METASCSTLPAALVTKEISPKIRLVPRFSIIATPMVIIKSTGSNQEVVVRRRTINTIGSAIIMIFWISLLVCTGESTSVTAVPDIALSSPMIFRISSTAAAFFSSSSLTVTENMALEFLYQDSTVSGSASSSGS